MASMEDLIATINGKLHAGQQGEDLKELHAKLAQTIHPAKAPFRPVPPPNAAISPTASGGPVPPPAPVSSWNEPMPSSANSAAAAHNAWGGMGNSPRQGGAVFTGKRQSGFSIPGPKQSSNGSQGEQIPYHASVLPTKASPMDTGGFNDDAFKPIWEGGQSQNQQQRNGSKN